MTISIEITYNAENKKHEAKRMDTGVVVGFAQNEAGISELKSMLKDLCGDNIKFVN